MPDKRAIHSSASSLHKAASISGVFLESKPTKRLPSSVLLTAASFYPCWKGVYKIDHMTPNSYICQKVYTMFGDMMEKLNAMKAEVEETKKRLDHISVEGEAESGLVKVVLTGNRDLKSIHISPDLAGDTEAIEDLISLAFTRALEKANNLNETEMNGAARGFMPNIPGM